MSEEIGSVVQGKVARIRNYGAFVELPSGEVGLVHISEISNEFVHSVTDYLSEGDSVTVKVLDRNEENKLNLSIKQVMPQDVASLRYEQEIAQVQRDLSEREKHTPRVEFNQVEEPIESPFMEWMGQAQKTLTRLERKRMKHKPAEQRPRHRRFQRRRSR